MCLRYLRRSARDYTGPVPYREETAASRDQTAAAQQQCVHGTVKTGQGCDDRNTGLPVATSCPVRTANRYAWTMCCVRLEQWRPCRHLSDITHW